MLHSLLTLTLGAAPPAEAADTIGIGVPDTVDFGAAIAGGDFNGDGLSDAAFAGRSTATGVETAVVHIHAGTSEAPGLSTLPQMSIQLDEPGSADLTLAAADVDGDGMDELLIGVGQGDATCCGYLQIHRGSSGGLDANATLLEGLGPDEGFGTSIAAAGDVNGDGFEDVVVGAPSGVDEGGATTGAVYLFAGSAQGLADMPLVSLAGEAADDLFGQLVSGGGDLNNDGYDDVLVSAPDARTGRGVVYLHLGSPSGPEATPSGIITGPAEQARIIGAMVGDIDGDGFHDAVIRIEPNGLNAGRLRLVHGTAAGPEIGGALLFPDPSGAIPARAGDVNGDGYDDLVVGASMFDAGGTDNGLAQVFLGGPAGLQPLAYRSLVGDEDSFSYGQAAIGIGDTDGDGYDELAIGGPGGDAGGVALLGGHPDLLVTAPDSASAGEEVQVEVQTPYDQGSVVLVGGLQVARIGSCLPQAGLCTGLRNALDLDVQDVTPEGLASFTFTLPDTVTAGSNVFVEAIVRLDGLSFSTAERSDVLPIAILGGEPEGGPDGEPEGGPEGEPEGGPAGEPEGEPEGGPEGGTP